MPGASKARCTGPVTRLEVPMRPAGVKFSPSIGHSSPSERPVTGASG